MQWTEKLLSLFRDTSGPEVRGPLWLKGNLDFPRGGIFDSQLEGKIRSRQTLLVGPLAEIAGDLRVENCQIQGKCSGRIDASASVRIDASGHYSGKLTARSLRVEPEADFQSELAIDPHPVFEEAAGESLTALGQSQDPLSSPS